MSPRGVTIPDVPAQLFQAAEQVLTRDGPAGLTSRAITSQAGVAKGILHNHFTDFDAFLAAFVVDRFRQVAADAARLPGRAGQATVLENLTDAAVSVFGSNALAIISLVLSRGDAHAAAAAVGRRGTPNLHTIEAAFAAYLDAEKRPGWVAADADTQTLAFVLIAAVHHLFVTGRAGRTCAAGCAGSSPCWRRRDCSTGLLAGRVKWCDQGKWWIAQSAAGIAAQGPGRGQTKRQLAYPIPPYRVEVDVQDRFLSAHPDDSPAYIVPCDARTLIHDLTVSAGAE